MNGGLKINISNLTFFILQVYIILFLAGTRLFNTVMLGLFGVLFILTLCVLLKKSLPVKGYIGSMGAFLLLAFLSTLWAGDKKLAMESNLVMLRCSALGLCIYVNCDTRQRITRTLACFALSVLVLDAFCVGALGIKGLIQLGEDNVRLGVDVLDDTMNANFIGTANVLGVAILLYFIAQNKKRLLLLPMLAFIGFIALSASRSALILLVTSFVLYVLLMNRNKQHRVRSLLYVAFGITAFVLAIQLGLFDYVIDRFRDAEGSVSHFFSGYTQSDRANIRMRLIYAGLSLFVKRPILGYGSGQYGILVRQSMGYEYAPHNTYIQAMVAYGIFGLVFWQGMYFRILWKIRKRRTDSLAMILFVLIVLWLVHDIFGHALTEKISYYFLGIGFAFARIAQKERTDVSGSAPDDGVIARLEQ